MPEKIKQNYSWVKSLSISLLIFGIFSLTQIGLLFVFLLQDGFTINDIRLNSEILEEQAYNFMGPISIYSSLLGILLIIYLSKLITIGNNLPKDIITKIIPINKDESIGKTINWILILFGFSLFITLLGNLLGLINEVEFTNQVLKSSGSMIFLFYGFGIVQPIFEEFLFRGLLFKGLNSKFGGNLTVFITSILFVIPHMQYDFTILILVLFPNALILGFARLKTGNLSIPIILHCLNNIAVLLINS